MEQVSQAISHREEICHTSIQDRKIRLPHIHRKPVPIRRVEEPHPKERLSDPSCSTNHISILRHSHGLIFYHGLNTSIAISIFASNPLPTTRTLWLQRKSWLGNAGMRVHTATGWNGKWLDVTPEMRVEVGELDPHDERA
jgi:hypothetical protein